MTARRFPPPWTVEETDACFIVKDRGGMSLAYVYFEEEPGRRAADRCSFPPHAPAAWRWGSRAGGGASCYGGDVLVGAFMLSPRVPMLFTRAASNLKCHRQATRCDPLLPRHQTQAEPSVVHTQVAVVSVQDRIGNNLCDLLRHDADVDLVAPDVAIAI
jgi:hypothetical protein